MKNIALLFCAILVFSLASETNTSIGQNNASVVNKEQKKNKTGDTNGTSALIAEKVKEQMEREKKYAKEQKFYQGDDYNLSEHEVDPKTLKDIPVIEPDYDFDITDVYRDDI